MGQFSFSQRHIPTNKQILSTPPGKNMMHSHCIKSTRVFYGTHDLVKKGITVYEQSDQLYYEINDDFEFMT